MFSTLTTLTVLGSCAYEPQSCQFTFTAVTVLGQFEAGPTVPAGVGSWAVQTQLAWAQVSHHALIHIWTQSTDTSEYKLPSLALNKTALLAVISSINNHRMSTPLSLSWAICRRSVWHHFFLFEDQCLIVLCKDGVNGARGGGVYDPKMMWCLEKVFWAQIKGVLGVISLTPNAIHSCTFTFVSNFQERNSHTHTHTHKHTNTHTHTHTHTYTHTCLEQQRQNPAQTQLKASPSHCCPSSDTVKPGWHVIHVKEPSVFVHVPRGHVVGSAHSSISDG